MDPAKAAVAHAQHVVARAGGLHDAGHQRVHALAHHRQRPHGGQGIAGVPAVVTLQAKAQVGVFQRPRPSRGWRSWLTTVDQLSGVVSTLGPEIADPGTLTQLIDDGEDTYDFTTTDADGTVTRFIGKESLTGQTLTVDGVTLEEAQNQMRALDSAGNELWRTNGTEYVSREWRIFFSGPGMTTLPNESFPTSGTPVEFIFPGEPGFLSTQPTTGCPG